MEDEPSAPPPLPPGARTPRAKPFELGLQFGGMRILDNPVASSSLYLGGRTGYRLPYQIVVGGAAQYDDFSARSSTGSSFTFWATRGELGYELSKSDTVSVLPYAELGYASKSTLWCSEPHECERRFSAGTVGALGLRFAGLGEWFYSGFELNYQFGHVQSLFFGVSSGIRL